MRNELLMIPEKSDIERNSLAKVWEAKGGKVIRISKFWVKPETNNKRITLYGFDTFCLVLAQVLELELELIDDTLITKLPIEFLKRKLDVFEIENIQQISFPKFIKPVTPKLFDAKVFENQIELEQAIVGLERKEKIICSSIVKVDKEVRAFILNRKIQDLAYYEGIGDLEEPRIFIERLLHIPEIELPETFVMDVGYSKENNWFVIEFNSSWGSGLNSCKPERVIDCIRIATKN